MRIAVLALTLAAAVAASGSAQTQDVTKIGVCNLTLVMQLAWDKTDAAREFVRVRRGILDDFVHLDREISFLESSSQTQAQKDKLARLRSSVGAFKAQRRDWLSRVSTSLRLGPALGEVLGVVNRVARANGYALVIRSDGTFPLERIIAVVPQADITSDVIDEIMAGSSP